MVPQADSATIATLSREYCVIDLYDRQGRWVESLYRLGDETAVPLDLRRLTALLAQRPCASLIVRHGHPSGCAEPSPADIVATRALAALARLLGLALHDHVIEAGKARFSFREAGLL